MNLQKEVTIVSGTYHNKPLVNIRCILHRPIRMGSRGWYGNFEIEGMGNIRVQLPNENSLVYHGSTKSEGQKVSEEISDAEISRRIEDRFNLLSEITAGVAADTVRSLIVSGAPGMGKSVGIQSILDREMDLNGLQYNKISGSIVSAYQLYQVLYENAEMNTVLILDDCDSLLFDTDCVNLLKAALESGERPRMVSYNSDSVVKLGLPKTFEFMGRVIFITNLNFEAIMDKDKTAAKHLSALVDRSLYLDLSMHTRRDIWCRIQTMVEEHDMLGAYGFEDSEISTMLEYLKDRRDEFRRLSLRTVVQLAKFMKMSPDGWRRMSEAFQIKSR